MTRLAITQFLYHLVLLDELEDAPKKFKSDNEDEGLKQRFLAAQNDPVLKNKKKFPTSDVKTETKF